MPQAGAPKHQHVGQRRREVNNEEPCELHTEGRPWEPKAISHTPIVIRVKTMVP